ncbi:MAG: exo-alpha-sialidase [Bacteroidota bacterium]
MNITIPHFPKEATVERAEGIYFPKAQLLLVTILFLIFIFPLPFSPYSIAQTLTASSDLKESIIFPYQTAHVHGPTVVELPNGDVLAAWFQGSGERWADDVQIMGARLSAGQTEWSRPFLMADAPGFPDVNPVLFLDPQDQLWLIWYTVLANQWETSLPTYRISKDYLSSGAPTWDWQTNLLVKPGDKTERGIQPNDSFVASVKQQMDEYETYWQQELLPQLPEAAAARQRQLWPPFRSYVDSLARGQNMLRRGRLLSDDPPPDTTLGYPISRRIGWQTKNKAFILKNRIIVPLYSDGLETSLFAFTDNGGEHWQFSNPVVGGIGIQPTIAIQQDGTLVAYLRDNGPPPQRMQRTTSADRGKTWTIARDTNLPNPGAGFDMVTLASGEWLIVYNDTEDGRHSLAVSISDDEGKSWRWTKHLELDTRGEKATQSHYPAVIQGTDGQIHVVYSYHRRDQSQAAKTIKYVSFSANWVKEGTK